MEYLHLLPMSSLIPIQNWLFRKKNKWNTILENTFRNYI